MKICIFCGANSSLDPDVEREIKKVMTHFAKHDIELVYGGAGIGIMGGLANELLGQGGKVTGIIPRQLMKVEIAHAGLTELHVVKDMHDRKKMMYDLSDAFLIFPGGMGTLDELFEILTWKQLGLHSKPIAILNINNYYTHLLQFLDQAMAQGLLKQHDRNHLYASDSWEKVWDYFKK
ncbi:MAG TPA: TIGR00730 family Rossman fold protein [Bacteriovoracaceae bacterium]|nr:TIGR00730 family Rossman fold protein [Bacteriovoracaceae bacterium]